MKRYKTIDVIEGSKTFDYQIPEHVTGSYICDRSRFIPVSELSKCVRNESIGAADLGRYDFPDGRDDGRDVPIARRRPELAEMSVDVRRQQQEVKSKIDHAKKVAEFKALSVQGGSSETSSTK